MMADSFKSPMDSSFARPKRKGSPGPGEYDPKPTFGLGQSHRKGQTSSFKSKSKRGLEKEVTKKEKGGDPGNYSPTTDRFGRKVDFSPPHATPLW